MFTTRQSDQLKLVDFGLAAKLDPNNPVKVTTGTVEFASPEVVKGEPVGFATDMWSVGWFFRSFKCDRDSLLHRITKIHPSFQRLLTSQITFVNDVVESNSNPFNSLGWWL